MINSTTVWINIDQQTAPPVIPPTITSVERTSNAEAMVIFEPQSLGTFEIAYYTANDSTTPYLVSKHTVTSVHFYLLLVS